jgi:cytochrome c-type biogenesis protein
MPQMLADYVRTGLSSWWAPGLAFVAGIVSFASPCVFPLVPGYLSFISGAEGQEDRPLVPILLFIGGFSAVFTALGAFTGRLVPDWILSPAGQRIAGIVIIAFGAFMILYALRRGGAAMYAERRPFLERIKPGRAGAFPLGMAFAAGWTPCIGPVLGAIFAIAASEGGAARGASLLLVYSLGLGVPFLLIGLGAHRLVRSLSFVQRHYRWIAGVSGAVMVAIGVLLASGLWFTVLQPFLRAGTNLFPGL